VWPAASERIVSPDSASITATVLFGAAQVT
jgi:hypothetical protein